MNIIEIWLSDGSKVQFTENHLIPGLNKQAKDIAPEDFVNGFRVEAKRIITPSLSDLKNKFKMTALV